MHVAMVTCFFFYIFLSEDKGPYGEDNPGWLHHGLQLDPSWDNTLPEAGQTCGPGEADGLHVYGTLLSAVAPWPCDLHLLLFV